MPWRGAADPYTVAMTTDQRAQLLAIVEVDQAARVQCQQPGCGHTVWKAVHVVRDEGKMMVLGSTCFAKRYGALTSLGTPAYGPHGRMLTAEERDLLSRNTQELLERFRSEQAESDAKLRARIQELQRGESERGRALADLRAQWRGAASRPLRQTPDLAAVRASPWPWMKPMTSMAYFKLDDGSGWVRVQRTDGQQMLVPLPVFDGWDEALPESVGIADEAHQAYRVPDIARAIAYLRQRRTKELVSGVWGEILSASRTA